MKTTCIIDTDMADAEASIPATAVADQLLKLTSKVLTTLDQDVAEFEAGQVSKRDALRQLVDRDRAAVARATELLNELYRTARDIADNKGRRDVLETVLRKTVAVDPDRTFDAVVAQLEQEMKLARGITGAMRVPEIGALLNQAAVQVDHLEERADALESNLREATPSDAPGSAPQATFAEALTTLRRDLDAFDAALPFCARAWDASDWTTWATSTEATNLVRYGRFTDERLGESGIPALIELPGEAGLLIEPGRRRDTAIEGVQSLVLRILAAFPPGSARFTFVDPKGLGDSVNPFLSLVGHEADLVEGVFTLEDEIEAQLSALSQHVETELLRQAHTATGAVAQPYRFIVVFDHPSGFNTRSIVLLRALTETGPQCGVFTIVLRDLKPGREPAEARGLPALRRIRATKDAFETEVGEGKWRLALDALPSAEVTTRITTSVLAIAEAPPDDHPVDLLDETTWWTGDATDHLLAAVGHASRVEPLTLRFDDTTATVLAIGRSGSGLSTLLHEVSTNLGVVYSPAELQLLMVGLGDSRDFDAYGQRRLPHARLVAVSADRELAASALESAVAEITRRTVLFQAAATQRGGYAAYRHETGNVLPRLLVVIDCADQLFARNDKLARHLRELLDRVALDGAASGVHLLLSSHVLRDAASLLDAIPTNALSCVVLPCDETDARAVFGANVADIELPREPGDAVIASALGSVATGRVAAAAPSDRAGALRVLRVRADAERFPREPQLVDGAEVARVERAPLDLLHPADGQRDPSPITRLWLGEPVALGSPVELQLLRQAGANLLVVAEDPQIGQGLLAGGVATAVLASGGHLELEMLDFMPVEDGFGEALLPFQEHLSVRLHRRRNLPAALDHLRHVVVNRLARNERDAGTLLFVLNGFDEAHDLALGQDGSSLSQADLFAHLEQIVREGPPVGVHTLLWGKSRQTLDAQLPREVLRSFGLRAVGQMDEESSIALIDSPMAAGLRPTQALLYDEPHSRLVRFRPYAIPDPVWLASVARSLGASAASIAPASGGARRV
jgi:hypothetical protein